MLMTPHAVTGATIGALMPTPFMAIPVALVSHYVLDALPHWQETLAPYIPTKRTYIRIPIDLAMSLTAVALIAAWYPTHASTIWVSAVLANIPDLDVLLVIIPRLKRGLVRIHWNWHSKLQDETSSLWGLVSQVTVIVSGLLATYFVK